MPERIESLIAKEVLIEFDRLNEKVNAGVTNFERLYSSAVQANKALGGSRTFKEVIDDTKKLEQAEKDLERQQRINIKLKQEQEKLEVLAARAKDVNAAASLKARKESEITEKQLERETKAQEKRNKETERAAKAAAKAEAKKPPVDDPTNANIPFTTNLDALEKENSAISALVEEQERLAASTQQMTEAEKDAANMAAYEAEKQEQLIKALEEKAEVQKKLDNNISLLQGNSTAELLVAERLAMGQNTAEQKKLNDAYKNGVITAKEYQQSLAPLIEEENRLKLSVSSLTKELQTQAKIDFSNPGSEEIITARIEQLKAQRKPLDITNPNEAGQIAEINKQIDQLNILLEENASSLEKQKINVGNYPTAFKGAFNALNGELDLVSKNLQSGGFKGKELDDLAKKQEVLKNATSLVSQEFKTTAAQQAAYKEAAKQIGVVYGTNSQVFKAFNKEVANGSKEINKVSKEVNSAANNTSKFGGAASVAFGKLRQLANIIPGLGISGVILLLLTPLISLGQSLLKYTITAKGAKNSVAELNEKFKQQAEILKESSSAGATAAASVNKLKVDIDLAKQGFIDKSVVVKEYNETIGKTTGQVSNLNEAEAALIKNADAYIKFTFLKAAATEAFSRAGKEAVDTELQYQNDLERVRKINQNKSEKDVDGIGEFIARGEKNLADAEKVAGEKRSKRLNDIGSDLEKQAAQISKNFKFDFSGKGEGTDKLKAISKKFFDDELKDQAAYLKAFAAMELGSEKSKSEARREAYRIEKSIIEGQRNVEIDNEKEKLAAVKAQKEVSKVALLNAQNEYNQRVKEINQKAGYEEKKLAVELGEDLYKIRQSIKKRAMEEETGQVELAKQYYKEIIDREKEHQDLLRKNADADLHYRTSALNEGADILLRTIIERENKEVELAKGNQEKIKKIREKSARDQLAVQLDLQKNVLKAELDTQERVLKNEKDSKGKQGLLSRIAELKKELEKLKGLEFDLKTEKALKKIEDLSTAIENVAKNFNDLAGIIGDAMNIGLVKQENEIRDQLDNIEKRKEKETEAVNNSLANEQEKADKIAIINQRAQIDKERLERRQRQIELQRARYEKAQAIANIVLNTAVAVTKLYSQGRTFEAIAAGVIGAAQLAIAAATPLPKFAKGTSDAPGGKVVVGDGGVNEYVKTPSGDVFETPNRPTVMDIEKHSIIYPNRRKAMEAGVMTRNINEIRSLVDHGAYMRDMTDRMTSSIGSKIDQLNSTIKNKTENHWMPKKDGWERIKAHGGNRSRTLNDR